MSLKALAIAVALSAPSILPACAATFVDETPFSQSAFEAAQKAEKPVLVHITASWCTTCAAQKPILDKLISEPRYRGLQIFNVDFDSQKTLVRHFGARIQSTLIVFKGAKELGRSSGETNPQAINTLLGKAL